MSEPIKLNLLDMLNAKLRHTQQSTTSTAITNIPTVHHGHMNDGIHDLTFGYANTNRVYHELISHAAKAIKEVKRKTTLGSLSDFITTTDDLSTDKLVVGKNGTITDSRFLRFTEQTPGIVSGIGDILAIYAADEENCIVVTKSNLYSYNITDYISDEPIVKLTDDHPSLTVLSTKLLTVDTFQIVTHRDIRHYKISLELIDADTYRATATLILKLDIDSHYADNKLVIIDVVRRNSISNIINSNATVDETGVAIEWFNDFIPLTTTTLAVSTDEENTNIAMQCLGILTGEFGIFELIEHSNGYYFLRIIDNDPVVTTLKYTKNGNSWIVVFNRVGVKTYKLLSDGVRKFSTDIDATDIPDYITDPTGWNWLPETGIIETFDGSGYYANINDILEYGVTPTVDADAAYSEHIPGAAIGDIMYKYYTNSSDAKWVALYDVHTGAIRCVFNSASTGMYRLVHDYDLYEFNGFKEVSVTAVEKYNDSDNHFIFAVKNVGIIHGERTYASDDTAGLRLSNIQKWSIAEDNNDVTLLEANQCIFVYNNKPSINKLYASAIDSDELLPLSVLFKPKALTKPVNDYVFVADNSEPNTIYRAKLTRHFTTVDTSITPTLINLITTNSDSALNKLFQDHLDTMHSDESAMTRFNKFVYDLKLSSVSDSTVFISDSNIAFISTGYGLKNIERIVTDKDSTNVYGRIKSKTCDSHIGMTTQTKRATESILFYDTVIDNAGNETSLNRLSYTAYKLADNIVKLDINVPTTFTYYVNNILGWSKGANTGAILSRENLNGGFLSGRIENTTTEYQLVLNRAYFNIKRIINANCQLASMPLGVYSDKTYVDTLHYGMFDSPIITPLCITPLLVDNTYEMKDNQNNEVLLTFCIFGGDALTITVLIETE